MLPEQASVSNNERSEYHDYANKIKRQLHYGSGEEAKSRFDEVWGPECMCGGNKAIRGTSQGRIEWCEGVDGASTPFDRQDNGRKTSQLEDVHDLEFTLQQGKQRRLSKKCTEIAKQAMK